VPRSKPIPPPLDGRRVRSHNSRGRIVKAMLELVGRGSISPRAEEVAARAGVALRTVFRHFDDMDTLYREMAEEMLRQIRPMLEIPFNDSGWPARLFAMIERRSRIFETAMPFKNAADVHRHRSAFLQKDYATLRRMERVALESALPDAIRGDRVRFDALNLLLSFDTWQRLREQQKITAAQARKTIEFAARTLISGS